MNTIPKEYLVLFNAVTDAVKALEELRNNLLETQCQAEDLYIAAQEEKSI